MQSKAKILGHPAHSTLIVFPLGLLSTGVVFDIVYLATGSPNFVTVAYWMIAAGIIGGLAAAPFGLIDWLAIPPGTRAKQIGLMHGAGNLAVLLLFIGSWLLRRNVDFPGAWAFVLSFAGLALVLITGWLGGELVDRLGVGVDDDAGLDAPNSLSKRLTR
ncbi:DUF2231 domain-containing protein [Methylocaldum sp. MU1018]